MLTRKRQPRRRTTRTRPHGTGPAGPGTCRCHRPWPVLHVTHLGDATYHAERRHDTDCGLPPTPTTLDH